MKTFYISVILLFVIDTLISTISGLLSILVAVSGMNAYAIIVGEILSYILLIYLVFYKFKTIPQFNVWFILLILVFYFIPKNFFYIYSLDELKELGKIIDLEKVGAAIFKFVFVLFACIKYYFIKNV